MVTISFVYQHRSCLKHNSITVNKENSFFHTILILMVILFDSGS